MESTARTTHTQAPLPRSRSGWQESETDQLFRAVKAAADNGTPLRSVFESLSRDLGRKPNSIRNYYYACLRSRPDAAVRSPAFQPFSREETHQLLRDVLTAQGQGQSVRSCVMALSGGSHSRMLRYQNKYRTVLRQHPEMSARVMEELRQEGLPCPGDELLSRSRTLDAADTAFCDPDDAAAARLMAQPCVSHMLEGLKELLRRAARAEELQLRLRQGDASRVPELQRALDRQKVEFDLQRLAWEHDYNACRRCLQETSDALRSCLSPCGDGIPASAGEALAAAEALLSRPL